MGLTLGTPTVDTLDTVVAVLREWQSDAAPWQLHPGDLGWYRRFGAEATAAAVRTWSDAGRIVAIGLRDGATLLRLTLAPHARRDDRLAQQLADDLADPRRGALPAGPVSLETPADAVLREVLTDRGWVPDEPWTPLRRDLTTPVPGTAIRVEVIGPERPDVRVEVQRAAFDASTFTTDHWHAMAAGPAYVDARCLVAYDGDDAVAAVTVWSAGPGRPGLVEPMGVHRDHRGRGHGRAVTLAAAAMLRELGASSALVCTPSSNVGGVATYVSAGFRPEAAVPDLRLDR
ncbi:GNAT family N-acetyltransferase [Saccharomonospora sp. NB11]|uniref:GNAT family N-acetyltransferase n=1 Tax=Saccharomonospora sp. NB11 TaxID=1642298 RepID=UPI0018D10030|nr:GNAT family N-acetyltransferase [Saccharomonospora sp. NB11]